MKKNSYKKRDNFGAYKAIGKVNPDKIISIFILAFLDVTAHRRHIKLRRLCGNSTSFCKELFSNKFPLENVLYYVYNKVNR